MSCGGIDSYSQNDHSGIKLLELLHFILNEWIMCLGTYTFVLVIWWFSLLFMYCSGRKKKTNKKLGKALKWK